MISHLVIRYRCLQPLISHFIGPDGLAVSHLLDFVISEAQIRANCTLLRGKRSLVAKNPFYLWQPAKNTTLAKNKRLIGRNSVYAALRKHFMEKSFKYR